ncbi:MAG: MFS transporter [Clostridiales bacterium]|nr:MFS transporter [Clostridiales bacterium]
MLQNDDIKLRGREAKFFILLCTLVYFTSYITRINYGAVILEITESLMITKKAAGLVSTVAFFTYGLGQVISGIIGDHIKPHKLIIFGLAATSVCNLAMPLFSNIVAMTLLWGVNGIFQAMFWPPLVKLMAENLTSGDYSRACVSVSVGSSIATIVIYLTSPLYIMLGGWKLVFVISAICGALMTTLWGVSTKKLNLSTTVLTKKSKEIKGNNGTRSLGREAVIILAMVCTAIVLQGILRDGVTTWMPTFVSEKFDLSSRISILTGVALPIFSMISYNVASWLQKKWNNELVCSLVLFAIGTVSAVLLRLFAFGDSSGIGVAGFSVLMMSILTGCMHGINLMLVSRIPSFFNKYGKISTVSGIVNAFTYVGSAISSYCFAALSEHFGWGTTVSFWAVIALLGGLVCALCIKRWANFKRSNAD